LDRLAAEQVGAFRPFGSAPDALDGVRLGHAVALSSTVSNIEVGS
jgi:hypothetical protein